MNRRKEIRHGIPLDSYEALAQFYIGEIMGEVDLTAYEDDIDFLVFLFRSVAENVKGNCGNTITKESS